MFPHCVMPRRVDKGLQEFGLQRHWAEHENAETLDALTSKISGMDNVDEEVAVVGVVDGGQHLLQLELCGGMSRLIPSAMDTPKHN